MKRIIFYVSLATGIFIAVYAFFYVFEIPVQFRFVLYSMASVFFLLFGSYGLYAEQMWKNLRAKGKTENLCVEANYYIQRKGFFARLLLFPFIKIKSSDSIFISLLGALAWVIILSILLRAFFG